MGRDFNKKRESKKSCVLILEGYTERRYFYKMKEKKANEKKVEFDIKPELVSKKSIYEQYLIAKEKAADKHTTVFWLLDADTIIKEYRESADKNSSNLIQLKSIIEEIQKERIENLKILLNTPCLEFWYLLHFVDTSRYYSKCELVCSELKRKELKDYQKSEKYYDQLYSKLLSRQEIALERAKKLGAFDFENPETAKAEIYRIIEFLQGDK